MSLLHRLVKTTSRRRVPITLITAYAAVTITTAVVSSILIVHYGEAFLRQEIETADRRLLSQVHMFWDESVVRTVFGIVHQEFLSPATAAGPISEFFTDRGRRPDSYFRVTNELTNIALHNDFVESVYLYRLSDDTLAASESGVTFNMSDRSGLSPSPLNFDLIKQVRESTDDNFWVSAAENTGFGPDRPTITFVRSVPLYSHGERPDGWVLINLDERSIMRSIVDRYATSGEDLMVVDGRGRVMAHSDHADLFEPLHADLRSLFARDHGFEIVSVDGTDSVVSWSRSAMIDWNYVSVTPLVELNQRLLVLRRLASTVMLVTLVLSVVVLIPLSFRLYKPLRRIVEQLQSRFSAEDIAVGEIALIGGAVTRLLDQVDDMQRSIEQNERLIHHKMVIDIVYGNIADAAAISRRLTYLGLSETSESSALVLVAFDRQAFEQLRYGPREYVAMEAADIVTEFFDGASRCVSYAPGQLVALVDDRRTDRLARVSSLMEMIAERLGIEVILSYSDTPVANEQLAAEFARLKRFDRYSYIHGYRRILSARVLESMDRTSCDMTPSEYAELESALRSGRIDEYRSAVEAAATRIRETRCSYESACTVVRQIADTVVHVFGDSGDPSTIAEAGRRADPAHCESLDESVRTICRLAEHGAEEKHARLKHVNVEFVQRIAEHIRSTVNRNTALVSVADEFGISPSHLSRLFKDALGVNFSEVVHEAKLAKAREVLVTQPAVPVADIASSLGYDNSSYFSRVFRKAHGVTPGVYRKQHIGAP